MSHAAATYGAMTVLVVEDEVLISEMVADILIDRGYEVRVVTNADEALRYLTSSLPIDLLFTDINLAGEIDGTTLAERARELRPHLPVVFASGRIGLLARLASTTGATCLPKPYNAAQLCSAVEGVFATRH